jgi:hypothetical protein
MRLHGYGWTQPGGYQIVVGSSPYATDDVALVQGGPFCVEADGTAHASSTTSVSNTSLTMAPFPFLSLVATVERSSNRCFPSSRPRHTRSASVSFRCIGS